MNVSSDHLGGEDEIMAFMDKIAHLVSEKNYDPTKLSVMMHDYVGQNSRIQKVSFYKYRNRIIALIFTDISGLKSERDFSQEINLHCKYSPLRFSIIEMASNKYYHIKKGVVSIPDGWVPYTELNKTFDRLSIFFK